VSVSEVGASVTYGEAAALIRELARVFGSHYAAARESWDFVPDEGYASFLLSSLLEGYIHTHRNEKDRGKPISIPRPWGDGKPSEKVSDEELEALLKQLEARSAFRDRDS